MIAWLALVWLAAVGLCVIGIPVSYALQKSEEDR